MSCLIDTCPYSDCHSLVLWPHRRLHSISRDLTWTLNNSKILLSHIMPLKAAKFICTKNYIVEWPSLILLHPGALTKKKKSSAFTFKPFFAHLRQMDRKIHSFLPGSFCDCHSPIRTGHTFHISVSGDKASKGQFSLSAHVKIQRLYKQTTADWLREQTTPAL